MKITNFAANGGNINKSGIEFRHDFPRVFQLDRQSFLRHQKIRTDFLEKITFMALEMAQGGVEFRFMPSVNLGFSRGFLEQIAASDPGAEPVVIWDQAGFHPWPMAAQIAGAHPSVALAALHSRTQPGGGTMGSTAGLSLQRTPRGPGQTGNHTDRP